jgi:hypothetical protein
MAGPVYQKAPPTQDATKTTEQTTKSQKDSSTTPKKPTEKQPGLSTLTSWLSYAESVAQQIHWNYFVIDQFLKGNHNVRGNPYDNTIEVVKSSQEAINFPINKVYSTFRAIRAFVTRNKPMIEIDPENSSDQAATYARRSNKVLERDNKLNNGRRLNKEWVYYGIKNGLGWRQIGYDVQKHCSIRWTIDPWDLLVGSVTGKAEDAPYLIKCIVRTVGYWNHKFPDKNVAPDNEPAADQYKRLSMEIEFGSTHGNSQPLDEQTAIGYECWYRVFEKNSLGGHINKCLFTKSEILSFEETPFDEFPFIPYESEILPNQLYPDGHLKHIIAPQRMLNLLNTQLLEYNHIVNRGRFLKDKNAGFKVIQAKEGQIIEKNPGKMVQVLNPPSLNPIIQWHINFSKEAIQDIGGQQDASVGRAPYSGASGDAIEALQQGDSNNISDLRDNFEDALAQEAAWILKMYSLFESEGFMMEEEVNGQKTSFGVVGNQALKTIGKEQGEKYYEDGTYGEYLSVLPEHQIKVSVTSQLGETREARLNFIIKLVELGVLPAQELLKYIEFPNTSDILERLASEAMAGMAMDAMKSQAGQPPQQAPGGGDLQAISAALGGGGPTPPPPPPGGVPNGG